MRFAPKDRDIIRLLAEYRHLQSFHLERLTGRTPHVVRRRLRALLSLGLARGLKLPDDDFGAKVWFLTQKGYDYAFEAGWVDHRIEASAEKSNKNLRHDLDVAEFHLKLAEELPKHGLQLLSWDEHYADIHDNVGQYSVNPDAFFGVSNGQTASFFFLEVERSRQTKYAGLESNLLRKVRAYRAYADGPFQKAWNLPNFRVITILPSERRVRNFVEKLQAEGLTERRFWFQEAPADPTRDFVTPKDEVRHSLFDALR